MDAERAKRMSEIRASLGGFSDFSQGGDLDEIDDPISAYFKQRCRNASETYFKKSVESDSDSSVGVIDVDNVSLFDVGEESEMRNLRFSEHMPDEFDRNSLASKKSKRGSEIPRASITHIESELDKQRALAQKALKRLSSTINETQYETAPISPEKRQSSALEDISSKLMNVKLSIGKNSEKDWFQPNFSPNTPRYFKDELGSFGGDDENLSTRSESKDLESVRQSTKRQSHYAKKVNSMLKELSQIASNSDLEFETQTKEEQINRFEEDEKKFKLENSALLHNSQISEFSGTDGQDIQWQPEPSQLKPEFGNKNLSIGQFFNLRSNRVSSLVGSISEESSIPNVEEQSDASTLTEAQSHHHSKSECSFPISEVLPSEKPTFRRCVSTYDLKRATDIPKNVRYSTDSCSSNSTVMIQDLLAEMESGLSGTQIYEKLMKTYGKKETERKRTRKPEGKPTPKKPEDKPASRKPMVNNETPKSSKEPKRKEMVRSKKEQINEPQKSPENEIPAKPIAKDLKEKKEVRDLKLREVIQSPRAGKTKKTGNNKGFFASTPKNQNAKSQNEKLMPNCGKVLIGEEQWEAPRVNSIQPIELNKSEMSDENEKTILVNSTTSSELNKKNNTLVMNDTCTIEDTIVAGDLTVLSQRIDDMKRDSVCIVRPTEPEEPVLLTVIQKLADLPKGSLDCSALTPLLRDQFPELLTSFPTPSKNSSIALSPKVVKTQDSLVALPGSWIKFPGVWGLQGKICACADLEKTILVPVVNISNNWLLLSVESLDLVHPLGKKLTGVKKNNEWWVSDFVVVTFKETIIPPDNGQSVKIFFKSKVALKLELALTFSIKELINGEVQTRSLKLLVNNVHPENYINVLPKDPISFGVIADQCFDHATVQVIFDGVCELPLTVYIEEEESVSRNFILKPCSDQQHEREWADNLFRHVFHEGEKQVLEFRVCFLPNVLLKEDSKTQDFKATLVLMLGGKTESDGILRKIPVKGAVGYAKFLCNPGNPLVFRTSERGQPATRLYGLKNVGLLPIALSISMMNENNEVVEGEDLFSFPKSFYLSRNEEASINITFNAKTDENFSKRFLKLQVQPNGRVIYEVELIGIITSSDCRPMSRISGTSVSSKSTVAPVDSVPTKLCTTAQSLSWAAVSLDKEARQSFQIKNLHASTVSVRISFERNLDAFKLVNENGEKVQKLRKVLKPNCPAALTVVFRPDVVGPLNTSLILELSHTLRKEKILLNGIGGMTNLAMRNVKTDLNGCKILRLQPSRSSIFENEIEFTNVGRIPGFVLIKVGVVDFSLTHDLTISPSSVVIHPDSSVTVKISQKLKHNDLQKLLSGKEICKIATISVITGDEPSRLRIRKLVDSEKLETSERLQLFTRAFQKETDINVKEFKDSPTFENEFLKSLKVYEIVVVVERGAEVEPSILEETTDEFFSFMSDSTATCMPKSQGAASTDPPPSRPTSACGNPPDTNVTLFSADSLKSIPSHKRVTKWLETLDCV